MSQAPSTGSAVRRIWRKVRSSDNPRWQGDVSRLVVGGLARHRRLSLEAYLWVDWALRRLLGQRLTARQWDTMTFTDKVNYRVLRVRDPDFQMMCDKLAMRDFVVERLGVDSVPTVLAAAPEAAPLDALAGPYVLKANHGSKMVHFVGDGELLSPGQRRDAESWLTEEFAWRRREWAYVGARRLLLAEEWLRRAGDGGVPTEYKLYTFSGKTAFMHVDFDRFGDHRRQLRRPDWSLVDGFFMYPSPDRIDHPRPPGLDLMLAWADELGRGFDFVRVDFYDVDDRIYVGELTPYPGCGMARIEPRSLDAWLGHQWRERPTRN